MLYLALSCLQGERMADAAEQLLRLSPQLGLQLTPGCAPTPLALDCATRTHHGFTFRALRAPVWKHGELVWRGDSLHPPLARDVPDDWQPPDDVVLETMYPGYAVVGTGEMIEQAMTAERPLAVDVAHIEIQRQRGVLSKRTLRRLKNYQHVVEVHVSTSHDGRDSHAQLTDSTWGVDWAKEKLASGTPVILECYMHRLSEEERLEQVARLMA